MNYSRGRRSDTRCIIDRILRTTCRLLAFAVAGIVTAFTIRDATFVPWGTDAASYVHAAERWAEADLFTANPFQLLPRWPLLGLPLGERPGAIDGTSVTVYPAGLPIVMAVGHLVSPELGPHLVAPIFAGLLVLAIFATGELVAGPAAGLLAAAMMALNPIALEFAVTPMSDVPATALLMIAIAMSLRPSLMASAAAGGCVAFAVLSRPVLAPNAAILVPLVLLGGVTDVTKWRTWRWRHAAIFAAMASLGPMLLALTQYVTYGDAFTPGYPTFGSFFSTERIAANFAVYTRNLATLHSPFIFLGLIAALPLQYAVGKRGVTARRMLIALMATVVINYAVYLPYLTYDGLSYTRFLLPAQAALLLLLAASLSYGVVAVARTWKWLSLICVMPAAIVLNETRARVPDVFTMWTAQSHVRSMGQYLREVLPANAAVISFLQSGAIAYYSKKQIVRFDLLSPADSEAIVEALLRRKYRPVFIVDDQMDWAIYVRAFKGTRYEKLDWPPRANFEAGSTLWLYDLADEGKGKDAVALDILR